MAKGDSEFAVAGPECQEVAGEHRRAVARPHRGRSPGTGDPDQAASMGVGPKTWARGEPDAWERARPVRRCGPGKRTLRKKHTAPRPDPYLTMTGRSAFPIVVDAIDQAKDDVMGLPSLVEQVTYVVLGAGHRSLPFVCVRRGATLGAS